MRNNRLVRRITMIVVETCLNGPRKKHWIETFHYKARRGALISVRESVVNGLTFLANCFTYNRFRVLELFHKWYNCFTNNKINKSSSQINKSSFQERHWKANLFQHEFAQIRFREALRRFLFFGNFEAETEPFMILTGIIEVLRSASRWRSRF